MDFDYATIGKHIQQYRFELDKTQEEIAEKANISKNYLSKIETGKSAGRLDKYYSIAKALGVTIDMLIDNTSNRASSDNQLFYNQLLSLISSLSLNQRKMLIEFIELLRNHNGEYL
ncbi:MAG: helix-turn-helix domain-containing protein [Clostridia bacterium]|uniref:helix-turn-helix domain-containing protein n=1 Tax=Clostridia TaxID=186801 RepID=UPI003995DC82